MVDDWPIHVARMFMLSETTPLSQCGSLCWPYVSASFVLVDPLLCFSSISFDLYELALVRATYSLRSLYRSIAYLSKSHTIEPQNPDTSPIDLSQATMRPENVWKWLDGVDEDNLDPLDRWGIPPPRRPPQGMPPRSDIFSDGIDEENHQQYNTERNAEAANPLRTLPPAGILLRNGTIRSTGQNPKSFPYDVQNQNHPRSLLPGFPTSFAHDVENESRPQPSVPGFAISSESRSRRNDAPPSRQLQTSGREGNSDSANPKRLPTFPERALVRGLSEAMRPTPKIHVEVQDPVAVNCQGARVVGRYQYRPKKIPGMKEKSRRNTTAGEGALHRSNAIRRLSNVRAEPK